MDSPGWLMEGNNHFVKLPAWAFNETDSSSIPSAAILFYFIPGNPGLIGYYRDFLSQLSETNSDVTIAGVSLGGFDIPRRRRGCVITRGSKLESNLRSPPGIRWQTTYNSLAEQVQLTQARITSLIRNLNENPRIKNQPLQVVLAGHSVGAYIALEVARLQHEQRDVHFDGLELKGHEFNRVNIFASMLLTPTIHNVARSRSGRLTRPALNYLPFFPALTQFGASALTKFLPTSWLEGIVQKITGMQSPSALRTTLSFLRAPSAVKQALMMAGQEMVAIGPDRRIYEIWNSPVGARGVDADVDTWSDDAASSLTATTEHPLFMSDKMVRRPTKHFFLFPEQDHWVAEMVRDAALEADGGQIVIEESGLVNAWCLDQSECVSRTVSDWLKSITDQHVCSYQA